MDRLMPFDELNVLRSIVTDIFGGDQKNRKQYEGYLMDLIEEILLLSYIYGNESANTMLESEVPVEDKTVAAVVDKPIADKTWRQRVTQYLENENATAEDIMRVAETDSHRVYNDAMWEVAEEEKDKGAVIFKRWETMLDDRVRETHEYLEGEEVPLDEPFWTFDGDEAMHPGDFTMPENNINCRCRLSLIRKN